MSQKSKEIIEDYLSGAGININGDNPWDIQVHDDRFYSRVLSDGAMAVGESYMEKWWDVERLDIFFEKIFNEKIEDYISRPLQKFRVALRYKLINPQSVKRSYQVGKEHYDRGLELFSRMLDSRLIYSCGYWKKAKNLEEAQEHKLDLICRKLELKPGMSLLDIGCGWGGLVKYAVEIYGVKATGITISKDQADYARKLCDGLPVKIKMQDYRNLKGRFDRIVSVGMMEHVGVRNYSTYLNIACNSLKDDGIFLLHTIGSNVSTNHTDQWIEKYIFPNSMIPSLSQITSAAEPHISIEDLHSFGPYYDRTLLAWNKNFINSWNEISYLYDETFFRMWHYYLMSSAASFRVRRLQLWQLLLTKQSRKAMITPVR